MPGLTGAHKLNITFVVTLAMTYLVVEFAAPKSNTYHFSLVAGVVLVLTVNVLWMATCLFGLRAWLNLDRYAAQQKHESDRRAFGQIANGVRLLAYSLLVSSLLTGLGPYFRDNAGVSAAISQANYYLILIFPFLGFFLLRQGTKRLAIMAEAALSLRAKVLTVGPPVALLAAFYTFLTVTNSAINAPVVEVVTIVLVVGAWVWGLLAALNIERATHRGVMAANKPLVLLYNGILTMTGGFIILDALSSLGTARFAALPLGVDLALLYTFIAVVCLGFVIVAAAGRVLMGGQEKAR